jgi:hypothetical protein
MDVVCGEDGNKSQLFAASTTEFNTDGEIKGSKVSYSPQLLLLLSTGLPELSNWFCEMAGTDGTGS